MTLNPPLSDEAQAARLDALWRPQPSGAGIPFLSVCSGIEAASVALEPLGFAPVGFAEIDPAAARLLARKWPHVRNFGDFTAIDTADLGLVGVLIGGTPCQAFSVAGKRMSLGDARGNLTLAYVVLAHELARSHGLRNCIWENVPGVLNTGDNAFGCFLGAIVGHDSALPQPRGAGWPHAGMVDGPRARCAWRVLDAQYFGLAQRRQRVFVVADFGNGADPAQVLFEPASLHGNSAPRREAGQGIAGTLEAGLGRRCGQPNDHDPAGGLVAFGGGNRNGPVEQAATLTAKGCRMDFEVETFIACSVADALTANQTTGFAGDVIAHSLRAEGFDASEDGTGRGTPLVPVCFSAKDYGADASMDLSPTLRAGGHTSSHANAGVMPAVAFDLRGREGGAQFEGPHDTANIRAASGGSSRSYVAFAQNSRDEVRIQGAGDIAGSLAAEPGMKQTTYLASQWAVRRLTPIECERLQGFPDDHTGGQADGPRYKQLGNSFAVPVIRWIGEKIIAATFHPRASEAA